MYLSHVFRTSKQEKVLSYPHRPSTPVQVSSHILFALSVLLHARDLYLCSTWQRALSCTPTPTHNTFNNLNTYYIH